MRRRTIMETGLCLGSQPIEMLWVVSSHHRRALEVSLTYCPRIFPHGHQPYCRTAPPSPGVSGTATY